jgi:hypothetical protein
VAIFYVSYSRKDKQVLNALTPLLEDKGHTVRSDRDLIPGMPWRQKLMDALLTSDGVIVLWSAHTRESPYVLIEIGAARATPHTALLPVFVGEVEIPFFLGDLHGERVPDDTPGALQALADKLDAAIQTHVAERGKHE